MIINRNYFVICLGLCLQACVPTIPLEQQDNKAKIDVPNKFPYQNKKDKKISYKSTANKSWRQFFHDKYLNDLIQTALTHNQELTILEQEINVRNNEIMYRRGEYIPSFVLQAGYEIEKVGKYTSQGINDETAEYAPGKFVPAILHNQRLGAAFNWEVDIWHKLRNATKSAFYQYLATIEFRKFAVTELVSEVAKTYYEILALDSQLHILNNYISTLKRVQYMVEARQAAGRATSLAVKRFRAEVLKNQSRVYKVKQKIVLHENNLNALLGRFPQKIKRGSHQLLRYLPKRFQTGVPTEMLDNRPDLQKAKYELISAKVNVDVAKARFYPALSIDGHIGFEAFDTKHLIQNTPESLFYNLASNLAMPIINKNAIKADYFSANNKQIQAIYNYELTTIKAYVEVANQMVSLKNLRQIYNLRTRQVSALSESVQISNMLFKAARVDYIEALLTQRDLLESQIELVEIKKQQLTTYVNLYKALGGGWR